jgi:hypothetical protein
VDESNECAITYTADEIPGVEVTAVRMSENSSVTYPIFEIPGVDVELDVEVTGVDKDLDAEPTGVKVDTGVAYGREAYDAVPQDQGNKTKVYGLGQQVPKEGKEHKEMRHKTAMARVIMLLLNLIMLVTLTDTTKAGVPKALPTTKGGVDAKIAIENETLHWHEVASTQKEHVLDTVPQEMAQGDRALKGPSVREDHVLARIRVLTTEHKSDRGRMKDLVLDRDSNPLIDRVLKESLRTIKESLRTIKESLRTIKESPRTMMIGADKRVLVGQEIPGVSLGYDGVLEMTDVAGCTISWQAVDEDVDDRSEVQLTRVFGREECLRRKRSPAKSCWQLVDQDVDNTN